MNELTNTLLCLAASVLAFAVAAVGLYYIPGG